MSGAPVGTLHDDTAAVPYIEGPRSPHDALQWAHDQIGIPGWSGLCLAFVRTGYNVASLYPTAQDAWDGAQHKHPTDDWHGIPVGAPVFMYGDNPAGHVAFNDGNGYMVTTNSGTGYPVRQSFATWASWGYRPLGWTEDLNGEYVCAPDGTSDVPDSEVIVPYDSSSTDTRQPIGDEYRTLEIDDDGTTSILYSPGTFALTVNVYVEGLPPGAVGKLRCYAVDTEDGGRDGERVANYPVVEFIGTTGKTAAQLVQFGNLGKPTTPGKVSRRLRAEILAETDAAAAVTYAGVRWFH